MRLHRGSDGVDCQTRSIQCNETGRYSFVRFACEGFGRGGFCKREEGMLCHFDGLENDVHCVRALGESPN